MTHFYERNIVDIKNEYTDRLTDILVPLLYEGMKSIYNDAIKCFDKAEEARKYNQTAVNPGINKFFQIILKGIPTLSQAGIEVEVKRIKEFSRCSDIFDDLVKAVVKSHIVLLTYNASGKTCKLVNERYHEKININEFIHKCYIECSQVFYDNPDLLSSDYPKDTLQMCKHSAYKYIKTAISDAIHGILPLKQILQEYLSNDYIVETINDEHSENKIKQYVTDDIVHERHNHPDVLVPQNSTSKTPHTEEHDDKDAHENGYTIDDDDNNKLGNELIISTANRLNNDIDKHEITKEKLEKVVVNNTPPQINNNDTDLLNADNLHQNVIKNDEHQNINNEYIVNPPVIDDVNIEQHKEPVKQQIFDLHNEEHHQEQHENMVNQPNIQPEQPNIRPEQPNIDNQQNMKTDDADDEKITQYFNKYFKSDSNVN